MGTRPRHWHEEAEGLRGRSRDGIHERPDATHGGGCNGCGSGAMRCGRDDNKEVGMRWVPSIFHSSDENQPSRLNIRPLPTLIVQSLFLIRLRRQVQPRLMPSPTLTPSLLSQSFPHPCHDFKVYKGDIEDLIQRGLMKNVVSHHECICSPHLRPPHLPRLDEEV